MKDAGKEQMIMKVEILLFAVMTIRMREVNPQVSAGAVGCISVINEFDRTNR